MSRFVPSRYVVFLYCGRGWMGTSRTFGPLVGGYSAERRNSRWLASSQPAAGAAARGSTCRRAESIGCLVCVRYELVTDYSSKDCKLFNANQHNAVHDRRTVREPGCRSPNVVWRGGVIARPRVLSFERALFAPQPSPYKSTVLWRKK